MRIDLYTKTVLTIIAACLVWLCLNDTMLTRTASAEAAATPQQVIIAGVSAPLPVTAREPLAVTAREPLAVTARQPIAVATGKEPLAVAYGGDRPLPVSLVTVETLGSAVPVRVVAIARPAGAGAWDPLDVNVKDAPLKAVPR